MRVCKNGHLKTPDNTYRNGNCRTCALAYDHARAGRTRTAPPKTGPWGRPGSVRRRKAYGLTPRQYDALVLAAQGRCDLCGRLDDNTRAFSLVIDHHHPTGGIRGLLCEPCNVTLGYVERHGLDLQWFALAVAYLARPVPPLRVPVLGRLQPLTPWSRKVGGGRRRSPVLPSAAAPLRGDGGPS